MELWKVVAGFEGLYEVSNLGRVRAVDKMQRYLLRTGAEAFRFIPAHLISQHPNNKGYMLVKLYKLNRLRTFTAHRLVALAFIPQTAPEVDHIDKVRSNNVLTNLRWVTRSQNLTGVNRKRK